MFYSIFCDIGGSFKQYFRLFLSLRLHIEEINFHETFIRLNESLFWLREQFSARLKQCKICGQIDDNFRFHCSGNESVNWRIWSNVSCRFELQYLFCFVLTFDFQVLVSLWDIVELQYECINNFVLHYHFCWKILKIGKPNSYSNLEDLFCGDELLFLFFSFYEQNSSSSQNLAVKPKVDDMQNLRSGSIESEIGSEQVCIGKQIILSIFEVK